MKTVSAMVRLCAAGACFCGSVAVAIGGETNTNSVVSPAPRTPTRKSVPLGNNWHDARPLLDLKRELLMRKDTNEALTNSPSILSNAIASPGVYVSEPYSMVVVVPEPHADDAMVAGSPDVGRVRMPVINPELRLVPKRQRELEK